MSIGSSSRLRTLMAGQRSEMGRKEDPRWRCLPTMVIGIIVVRFQIEGISVACFDRL